MHPIMTHIHVVTAFRVVELKCRSDVAFDTRESSGTNTLEADVTVNVTECQKALRAVGFAMERGPLF